ncbi:MAG: ATP-binding cassette domain-containing protein [Pseudomonadota bacterium]
MTFKIELKHVSFAYEGSAPILDRIDVSLRAGEVVGLVSAVGGGKSTFLKICAGLIEPTSGEVIIDDKKFWNLTNKEQNELRSQMGFDFQEGALIANMNVFGNLALPMRYHGRASEKEIIREIDGWLERMQIKRYRDVLPAALSAGLKRRVSYIRAMMVEGIYYFWDEPTEGTDDEHATTLKNTLLEKKGKGIGSLVSTQNASFLRKTADRVIALDDGKVRYDGALKDGRIPVEF